MSFYNKSLRVHNDLFEINHRRKKISKNLIKIKDIGKDFINLV